MNVTTSKRDPASAERFNNWYYSIVCQHQRSNVRKIKYDDLHFDEDDVEEGAYYEGKAFTGLA